MVRKYLSRIESIASVLPGVYTVSFSSQKRFAYYPGQFLHLAIDAYDGIGQWPDSRCFSIQSNCADEQLKITYSVKGSFTQRMERELHVGRNVWLKLPYGEIFMGKFSKENCVFIAGGTGITPFISLFTDPSFTDYQSPVLYYGIRTANHNIFQRELAKALEINPSLKIIEIVQELSGILNIQTIYSECMGASFFISGPPEMIEKFTIHLVSCGVDRLRIITDNWE